MLMKAAAAAAFLLLLSVAGLSAGCAPTPLTALLGAAPALPPCGKLPAAPPPSTGGPTSNAAGQCPRSAGGGDVSPSPTTSSQCCQYWNRFTPDLCYHSHENLFRKRVEEEVFPCSPPRMTPPPKESNISSDTVLLHKSKEDAFWRERGVCPRGSGSKHASTVSRGFSDSSPMSKLSDCDCKCTLFNEHTNSPRLILRTPAGRPQAQDGPVPEVCDLESFCDALKKMRGCSLRCLPTFLCRRGGGRGDRGGGDAPRDGAGLRDGGGRVYAERVRGRRRRSDVAGAILTLALAGVVALVAVAVLAALLTAVVTAALVVAAWDSERRPTLPIAPRRPSSTR